MPFWLWDPRILITDAREFFPFTENDRRCTASALNSFTRFGIYLGILLAILRLEWCWLLVGVAFAAFAVGAWLYMEKTGAVREGFDSLSLSLSPPPSQSQIMITDDRITQALTSAPILDPRDVINQYVPDIIGSGSARTLPTAANPFMNVLLTEIADNPYRSPALNIQGDTVRSELDSYFQTTLSRDPGDVFNHTQSQRAWVTAPSSTIPNDQGAFADWLYRVPGQTCKEGNLAACVFTTGAEALPWRQIQRST